LGISLTAAEAMPETQPKGGRRNGRAGHETSSPLALHCCVASARIAMTSDGATNVHAASTSADACGAMVRTLVDSRDNTSSGPNSSVISRVILRDLRHEPNDDDPADSNDGHASALSLIVF
jgi:hypothetical protein